MNLPINTTKHSIEWSASLVSLLVVYRMATAYEIFPFCTIQSLNPPNNLETSACKPQFNFESKGCVP